METVKKRSVGRPRKADAKRHVFAFRFNDEQIEVIKSVYQELRLDESETLSEMVARTYSRYLQILLKQKQENENKAVSVPLSVQYRKEQAFRRPRPVPYPDVPEGIEIPPGNVGADRVADVVNLSPLGDPEGIEIP